MGMSVPYEATGRTGQKTRTRQALVDAARVLLSEGSTPQVEDAAARAGISRTTAYRYFPNQRSLLVAAQPQISPETLLPDDAPAEPHARLDAFMTAFTRYNLEWEPQLRTALRLALEPGTARPALRQGRAIGWIEHALEPLRASHPRVDVRALAIAIRSATGIEALIWLLDVAGYSRKRAGETLRGTARALLEAALAGAHSQRRPARNRP
jgi:AcrR family transcriptional regulator